MYCNVSSGGNSSAATRAAATLRRPLRGSAALCLIAWLAILAGTQSWAQDTASQTSSKDLLHMPMKDLMQVEVYSASKQYQDASEAPSSVSVVTSDQIERLGYRTLADVLRSLNGFYVTNDRNYSYIGTRGFSPPGDYNGRILLLIDGHRLNDNVYDGALIGAEFPLDLDQVERVEVVRGPSSSLYGSDAFFAVINVITKKRNSVRHGTLSFDSASFGSYKGHFSLGTTLPQKIDAYIAGAMDDSAGHERLYFPEFDTPANNNGFALQSDYESSRNFLANLSFHDFSLQAVYGSREKGIPTASFGTIFNDPRTRTVDTQAYVDLTFRHKVGKSWEFMGRMAYDWYAYTGSYLYSPDVYGTPADVVNRDLSRGEWVTWEGQVSKRLGERHRVTAGSELRDNLRQDQKNYNIAPYSLFLDLKRDSLISAVYLQDEYKISHQLVLNAGIRYDHYSTFGGTTNPRLGLMYSPFEKTKLKLLYGQAFRAPNDYELFYEVPGSAEANPGLRPESIRTYELAIEQHLTQNWRVGGSLYEYRVKNLISQQIDPLNSLLVFANAQRIKARGLELEAAGKWNGGTEVRFSYAAQESRDGLNGFNIANSPRHLGKANLVLPFARQSLFLGVEGQYTGPRLSITGTPMGGFATANVTLLTRKLAGMDFSASLYNIFDKVYADPGSQQNLEDSIRQDGRSFRLKVRYAF